MYQRGVDTRIAGQTRLITDRKIIDQLGEWDEIIEKLKARADKVDPEMKIEYLKLLAVLRDKRNAIVARMEALSAD